MSETSLGESHPEWENDQNVKECNGCDKSFTMRRRRHHCRGCGRIFCEDCSAKKYVLPESFGLKGKQRVCNSCHAALVKNAVEANPDAHPKKMELADYDKFHEEVIAKVKKIYSDGEDTWAKKAEKNGVLVHTKKMKDSALFCVRTKVVIKASHTQVMDVYCKKDNWKIWQPDLLQCETVEQIDESKHREVIYSRIKIPVIDNRDTCTYSCAVDGSPCGKKDAFKTLIGASVVHPLCPKTKKTVRAIVNVSVTTFTPMLVDGQACTEVETILHTDPRGLVPPIVVNKGVGRAADSICDMRTYIEENTTTTLAAVV